MPYLVTGPEGALLIDTGLDSPQGEEALREQLHQTGVRPDSVKTILLTHGHPDHTGLVRAAKGLTGARTAMHRTEWESNPFRPRPSGSGSGTPQTRPPERAAGDRPAGQDRGTSDMDRMRSWYLRHGMPASELEEVTPHAAPSGQRQGADGQQGQPARNPHAIVEPDVLLNGGDRFSTGSATLEAVFTPGHTPGHVCYYDRERRLLFSGDHILSRITSNVTMYMSTSQDPLGDYLASVDRVGALDVGLVLPAHQETLSDLSERVRQLHRHHDARLEAVLAACAKGPATAYEVAAATPWDSAPWVKMEAGLRRAALGEILAHLEYLRARGKVERIRDDSMTRWVSTPGR
jgi:glyoxylase-like metal-dependent hydrolase (beta-lactamase superfamily II)